MQYSSSTEAKAAKSSRATSPSATVIVTNSSRKLSLDAVHLTNKSISLT